MQRFELTAGTSSKFWAIEQRGRSITVRFGRIGTEGQTKVTSFATASEAQIAHDKLVAEKRRKGYAPAGRGNVPTVKAPRTSQARRTVTKAKTPDSPATTTKRAATRAPTSERPLRFVLQNKSSTKHADLHVAGDNLVTRVWFEDTKGRVTFDRQNTRKGHSADDAQAVLLRQARYWLEQKYVHDASGAPLPAEPQLDATTALCKRLEAVSFGWKRMLQRGAVPSALQTLQKKLRRAVPEDLGPWLRWRNGMASYADRGFRCWGQQWLFLSADDIAREHAVLKKTDAEHAGSIPFAHDRSGNYLCIDTSGVVGARRPGQVIVHWRDEEPRALHDSFATWLVTFVEAMEAGVLVRGEKAWRAFHAERNPGYARV